MTPWGEQMAPATGTTGQIVDALAALRTVGITEDNLALAALAAAGRIAGEPERTAEALRRHRCQEDTGSGAARPATVPADRTRSTTAPAPRFIP